MAEDNSIKYEITVLCGCGQAHSFEEWQRCPLALVPKQTDLRGILTNPALSKDKEDAR